MKIKSTKYILYASIFTALTAAGAFVRIPFYIVPVTLQTFFTILAGGSLKPGWAFSSQLVYLGLGLLGLPIFSNGGGIQYIFHPTFGYLLALPIASFVISSLSHGRRSLSLIHRTGIHIAGSLIILFIGAFYLYFITNIIATIHFSLIKVLTAGILVFIPVEVTKSYIAAWMVQKLENYEVIP
jgi:biotin transport system substrate-specific component